MTARAGSFTDPALIREALYATPDRLTMRSRALLRAKTCGQDAGRVIGGLAARQLPPPGRGAVAADLGCGRGGTTRALAASLPAAAITAIDLSPALLAAARERLADVSQIMWLQADFHRLPCTSGSLDLAVAAFCLYHSAAPAAVIAEISRCLRPGAAAILVTKSVSSYRELDRIVAASGLDAQAESRPSLYQAAHSGNLPHLARTRLQVTTVIHETHEFTFASLAHAAEYLATSPKYDLPAALAADPGRLAAALRRRLPDRPVTVTSTVTYVVATRPRNRTS